MELSKRLQAVADMVTPGNRVADVGCDHGFVSIYLYRQGIAPKVYAMDVRKGPLAHAKEHIEGYGLSSYIETRLSDGVKALKTGEADTLICAGMGGRLMVKIISEGMEKVSRMQELILQPQSELAFFREFLRTQGFLIVQEKLVKEEGKYYPMMRVIPAQSMQKTCGEQTDKRSDEEAQAWQRRADMFGPCLLKERHPVLREYLLMLQERNERILAGLSLSGAKERREELSLEQEDIRQCLTLFSEDACD